MQNFEGHNAIINSLSVNADNVMFSGGRLLHKKENNALIFQLIMGQWGSGIGDLVICISLWILLYSLEGFYIPLRW